MGVVEFAELSEFDAFTGKRELVYNDGVLGKTSAATGGDACIASNRKRIHEDA